MIKKELTENERIRKLAREFHQLTKEFKHFANGSLLYRWRVKAKKLWTRITGCI